MSGSLSLVPNRHSSPIATNFAGVTRTEGCTYDAQSPSGTMRKTGPAQVHAFCRSRAEFPGLEPVRPRKASQTVLRTEPAAKYQSGSP